jgi:hypothetical protein
MRLPFEGTGFGPGWRKVDIGHHIKHINFHRQWLFHEAPLMAPFFLVMHLLFGSMTRLNWRSNSRKERCGLGRIAKRRRSSMKMSL